MSEPLEFTGERFTPESVREIWYEHLHRYVLVAGLVKGLKVLDADDGMEALMAKVVKAWRRRSEEMAAAARG